MRVPFSSRLITTMKPVRTFAVGSALILSLCANARAADILQNVPTDTLGFVVIKNLNATDTKVGQLLKTLNAQYPPPLLFLEAVTGIREGLDAQGDFLIAMLPPSQPNTEPQYCVWLPVADYDRMLTLLEATPGDPISAIRIADEDLLVARQGDWAVLMDPDQRPRMEQMLSAAPNPPAAAAKWKTWIDNNDVAIVCLQPGIRQILEWSAKLPKSSDPGAEQPEEDVFGELEEPAEDALFVDAAVDDSAPNPLYDPIRIAVHKWVVRSSKVEEMVSHAEAIGAAARLDDAGNVVASLRLRSTKDDAWHSDINAKTSLPSALFTTGEFIANGAGHFPPGLTLLIASIQARRILDDLKVNDRIELDDELAAEFEKTLAIAASDVAAWSIVHKPGDLKTGVHNNNFLVLRVASSKSFLEHADDAMQRWNTMHRESPSEAKYVFDIEDTKLGDRQAIQYLLDIGATGGLPAIPEIRQLMEKFFGPGGKMRMWIVPVDDQTVLVATATPEQVTAALQALDRREPIQWNKPELAAANMLLPDNIDWRIFFSPRNYYEWKRRETEATNNGVPVIGAKPAKEFPASPPVAIFGKVHNNELEVNAAITADTIKSAGMYFK
jgi:hypothetical protein